MRWLAWSLLLAFVVLLGLGLPWAPPSAALGHYYGSPEPILPMTFIHGDHETVSCIDCHHNYVDNTGQTRCMHCHVTDETVWPLFEEQFHELCRGCHVEHKSQGKTAGPTRRCADCHRLESVP